MADIDITDNVTTFPSPASGGGSIRNAKGQTSTERSRRLRARRKAKRPAAVAPPVAPPLHSANEPVAPVAPATSRGIDVTAYIAAIALAGAAAWFSIRGMVVL